jgi:hypothetical protein
MSSYDSQVQHVAGAVELPLTGAEQQLLTALGGLLTVNAGIAGGVAAGDQGPYVAVFNSGPVALPFVAQLRGQQTHGSLACGRTTLPLAPAEGELAILQLQIGPIRAGSSTEQGDVLTLVLSAERSAPGGGELWFLGQAIGGHAA